MRVKTVMEAWKHKALRQEQIVNERRIAGETRGERIKKERKHCRLSSGPGHNGDGDV